MLEEILKELESQLSKETFDYIKNKTLHLGIFTEHCLSYMLDGKKIIESRFNKNKIIPFNNISKDDIVFVKKSGGDIVAYFSIKDVLFFDLKDRVIDEIKSKYNQELCVSDDFWKLKENSNYATLIFIDKLVKLKPFHVNKRGMQTWIRLTK